MQGRYEKRQNPAINNDDKEEAMSRGHGRPKSINGEGEWGVGSFASVHERREAVRRKVGQGKQGHQPRLGRPRW